MSHALTVVTDIYEAFGRGDLPAVLSRIAPNADLQFEGPAEIPWTGRYVGHDGWTRFFQQLGGHVAEITLAMQPFAVDGEHVAVAGRYQGRVRATGQRIDSPLVHLWTVRDGKVVACLELTNTAAEAAACVRQAPLGV